MASSPLPAPEVVTVGWLINHCPLRLWSELAGMIISCTTIGFKAGEMTRPVPPELKIQIDHLFQGHNDNVGRLQGQLMAARTAQQAMQGRDSTANCEGIYRDQIDGIENDIKTENQSFKDAIKALR